MSDYTIANDRELSEARLGAIEDVAEAQKELAQIEREMDRRGLRK